MVTKPRLIITAEQQHSVGLAATTWEQRQGHRDRNGARIAEAADVGMTAKQLIKHMGTSHVSHPDYQGRDYTLNPEPNLTEVQSMLSGWYKTSLWAYIKRACMGWTEIER
jgi:hypothetical protein